MAVKPATEGTTFTLPFRNHDPRFTVGEKCDGDQGHWACVTHREEFTNNMMKDSHCSRGDHVLAWFCHEHGPEVPW